MFPPQTPPPGIPASPDVTIQSAGLQPVQATVVGKQKEEAPNPDQEILELAHQRFRRVADYENTWRAQAVKELNFVDGLDHWDQTMKDERTGRPCLTFDRIGPSVDQVVNDARQNPPEPRFAPVGSGADKWTAEILQGLLRNCESDSHAEIPYMTGYEHAVKIGRGWWRLHIDYEDPGSNDDYDPSLFLQKITIKRIANPFSVYPDPAADEYDYSDMEYCFVTEDLPKDVFTDLYPDAQPVNTSEFDSAGNKELASDWFPEGNVRVAEYWWVERDRETIVQLKNGMVLAKAKATAEQMLQVQNSRVLLRRRVLMAKINGTQVLEKVRWVGQYIPLIPVLGKEIWKQKRRAYRGMIGPAMDANLSYDFMRSKEAEAIGLAPLSTWLVAAGQLDGQEGKWTEANRKAHSYLTYIHKTDEHGNPIPMPQRIQAEPAVQAISQAIAHNENDIKATLSTYDASLGNAGPESSGRAIFARQRESDNAHFNYHGNLAWSLMHTARVFVDLVPHVYQEKRLITVMDPDYSTTKQIMANAEDQAEWAKGQDRIYKFLPAYRFAITMGTGPSYASRDAWQKDALVQVLPALPILGQRAPDKVLEKLGFDKDIVDRVRPPDIEAEQEEGGPPVPKQAQDTITKQGQMIQLLSQQMNEMSELIKTKKLELDSKERIAMANNATQLAIADLKAGVEQNIQMMQAQVKAIEQQIALLTTPPPEPSPAPQAPPAAPAPQAPPQPLAA